MNINTYGSGSSFPNKSRMGSERWKAGRRPSGTAWEVIKASREGKWAAGAITGGERCSLSHRVCRGEGTLVPRGASSGRQPSHTSAAPHGQGLFLPWKCHTWQETFCEQERAIVPLRKKDNFLKTAVAIKNGLIFSCVVSQTHKIVSEFQKDSIVDGSFGAISQPEVRWT